MIIVTAMGNERVAAEAMHRGVAEYVRKTGTFYDDLPDVIDYVLITHNHQDHLLFETMLQIRSRIKHVVVPRNGGGDEIHFVEAGSGVLESVFGVLAYRQGDYVVIPKGSAYRWVPAGAGHVCGAHPACPPPCI